jgi:hypothetical protein
MSGVLIVFVNLRRIKQYQIIHVFASPLGSDLFVLNYRSFEKDQCKQIHLYVLGNVYNIKEPEWFTRIKRNQLRSPFWENVMFIS